MPEEDDISSRPAGRLQRRATSLVSMQQSDPVGADGEFGARWEALSNLPIVHVAAHSGERAERREIVRHRDSREVTEVDDEVAPLHSLDKQWGKLFTG